MPCEVASSSSEPYRTHDACRHTAPHLTQRHVAQKTRIRAWCQMHHPSAPSKVVLPQLLLRTSAVTDLSAAGQIKVEEASHAVRAHATRRWPNGRSAAARKTKGSHPRVMASAQNLEPLTLIQYKRPMHLPP